MPRRSPARRTRGAAARLATTLSALALLLAMPAVFAGPPPGPLASHVAAPGLCSVPVWMVEGDQADCRFGTVAPAGDVNHDGYDDVLVGSYNYDRPEVDEGVVFLFLGGPGGLASAPAWIGEANQAGARLADKLSGAGDVDGDGYDDVVLGAAFYDSTFTDAGAAFLYRGSPSGLQGEPAWIAIGDQADEQFAACSQAAGDVNGDGYDDVIVGAWLADHGQVNEGRAFVYFGSDTGLADQPGWQGEGDDEGAAYGYFCASAGDVNADGYDDIVVGARRFGGNGLLEEGRVYVYHGGPSGPSLAADWIHDAGREKSEEGASTISAGDVNGDGFGDLLVGSFRWENPDLDEGRAMLFLGSASGLAHVPAWEVEGGIPRNNFGYHLDGAGDVNGDGFGDVIVSAPGVDTDNFENYNAGQVTLWMGSASGLPATPVWTLDGDQDYMALESVRGVGDVNGDGFADVAVGSLYRDGAFVDAGRAWVFYGCSDGRTAVPPGPVAGVALALAGTNPAIHPAVSFTLAEAGFARLSAFDLSGRRVATLFEGAASAGTHRVEWPALTESGEPLPAGVYVVQLDAQGITRRVKIGLLR